MPSCPDCGRELPGMEKLCRECFEQHYAGLSAGKTGSDRGLLLTSILAVLLLAAVLLHSFFPHAIKETERLFGASLLAIKLVLAFAAVGLGIYESLKWRSAQNLLFWIATGLNVTAVLVWFSTRQNRWLLLAIVIFLIEKGWINYQQNQAA
jgi:hypothetical protein